MGTHNQEGSVSFSNKPTASDELLEGPDDTEDITESPIVNDVEEDPTAIFALQEQLFNSSELDNTLQTGLDLKAHPGGGDPKIKL